MSELPSKAVHVRSNARRAALLSEEATLAALAGKREIAEYLQQRAFAWLVGQKA